MRIKLQAEEKDGLKITIVRDRQGLDAILEAWQKLQDSEENPVPGVDPRHYISELDSMGSNASPYVVCLHRESQLEAMLIGRLQKVRMPIRLGYLTLFKIRLRQIHIFHGGLLGQKGKGVCSLLLKTLRDSLNNGDADLAVFNHFDCDSVTYGVISRETPSLSLSRSPRIDRHWEMEVPASLDDFYAKKSAKKRKTLRWTIRKLEKAHKVYMKTYADPDGLEEGIVAAAGISQKTYQSALDSGFPDNPQIRDYLLATARRRWLRLYILYVDNSPVAYEWGVMYGRTFFIKTIGFDPEWRDWSVGTVLFLKVLEALCVNGNIGQIDFGFGDAEYKKVYGHVRADTRSLFVFADRLNTRLISISYSLINKIWGATAYIAKEFGIERRIKRLWRDRLRRKQALRNTESDRDFFQSSDNKEQ